MKPFSYSVILDIWIFVCYTTIHYLILQGRVMAICQICHKGTMAGRNIRHKHSGLWERKAPATVRTFDANIQKRKIVVAGVTAQVNLCTKCIKRIRKEPGWNGLKLFTPTAHEKPGVKLS